MNSKTPLTSIKAAASSILDEAPPAQQELVTVIEEETDRLDSLVTENHSHGPHRGGGTSFAEEPGKRCGTDRIRPS